MAKRKDSLKRQQVKHKPQSHESQHHKRKRVGTPNPRRNKTVEAKVPHTGKMAVLVASSLKLYIRLVDIFDFLGESIRRYQWVPIRAAQCYGARKTGTVTESPVSVKNFIRTMDIFGSECSAADADNSIEKECSLGCVCAIALSESSGEGTSHRVMAKVLYSDETVKSS